MNRISQISSLLAPALALAVALAAAPATAESGATWQTGSGFQLGGIYFHVVSVAPNSEALFRVSQRLEDHGLEEHPDCYRVSRTFYHWESCPVVQEHFRRFGDEASGAAPAAAPASWSSGSHPINYVQGNYVEPQQSYWPNTGFWFSPWLGYGSGLVRPPYRPGFGPGGRPGHFPGHRPGRGPGGPRLHFR